MIPTLTSPVFVSLVAKHTGRLMNHPQMQML